MRRDKGLALASAGLLVLPGTAHAHLVNSGLGPLYDGALHLLLSPGDLLGLVALALLAGMRGPRAARLAVVALPIAWLLAGLAGLALPSWPELAALGIASFLVLGLLVAADARLPPIAVAVLAGMYGALHGLSNGVAVAAAGGGPSTIFGIVLGVLCLAVLATAAVIPLRAFWARIAVRVAGSWVAAVGMLMLGWLLQGSA